MNFAWTTEKGDLFACDGYRLHLIKNKGYTTTTAVDSAWVSVDGVGECVDYESVILKFVDSTSSLGDARVGHNETIKKGRRHLHVVTVAIGNKSILVNKSHYDQATSVFTSSAKISIAIDRLILEEGDKYAVIRHVTH